MVFLCRVFDVCVDEKQVGFAVVVLDSSLEAVEASGFRGCDFCCKIAAKVLVDDAIRCSKVSKHMGDEVAFVVG